MEVQEEKNIFIEWDATKKKSVIVLHYEDRQMAQMASLMDQRMDIWEPLEVIFRSIMRDGNNYVLFL